jgi:hypothetical protein
VITNLSFYFYFFHSAWDYSAWVRIYALYLEERLECFRVLKYDVETDPPVCNLLHTYFLSPAFAKRFEI